MTRPRNLIPSYRKHSQTGRAAVSIYRADGSRTEIVLPGKYGSDESREAYESLLARLRANEGKLPDDYKVANNDITVTELVLKFMAHAEAYYVDPDKNPTSEIAALKAAVRPLVRLYGGDAVAEFGPLALQTLRTAMASGTWQSDAERHKNANGARPLGLARSTLNKNINRIKLVFKWGASQELVPAAVAHGLATVAGLRRGRSAARETAPVTPVSGAIIDDTLPKMPPVIRDMVEVLLLTGMRCGELTVMRGCDLDMAGDIWLFRPVKHKGKWRGRDRVIAIGPRAQEIIRQHLTTKTDAFLFQPAIQDEMVQAQRRAKRKTPLYPSHAKRLANKKKPNGKRRPGARFNVTAVNRAIGRACKRAGVESWHVHQLRHSASLNFSRELGLEAARAALGHSTVDMSAMYAGRDLEAAKAVASKLG